MGAASIIGIAIVAVVGFWLLGGVLMRLGGTLLVLAGRGAAGDNRQRQRGAAPARRRNALARRPGAPRGPPPSLIGRHGVGPAFSLRQVSEPAYERDFWEGALDAVGSVET